MNLHNIEKSAFHKGEYVGYCGGPWRIEKTNSSYGNWCASSTNQRMPLIFAFRLKDISAKLTALEKANFVF